MPQLLAHFYLVLLLVGASPAVAQAAPPVLTPDVGPQLESAFARAAPAFRLQDAQIKPHSVEARVCRPDANCFDVHLTRLGGACAGAARGDWCIQFPDGTPRDADALLVALDNEPAMWPYLLPHLPPGPHSAIDFVLFSLALFSPLLVLALVRLRRVPWRRLRPLLPLLLLLYLCGNLAPHFLERHPLLPVSAWLLIWWGAPILWGGSLGLLVRWGAAPRPASWQSAALVLTLVPALWAAHAVAWHQIGAMDGAAMGVVAALACLALAHAGADRRTPWVIAAGTTLVSLLALEVAARVALPPPPVVEAHALSIVVPTSPRPDHLPVAAGNQLVHCALHGSLGEETSRCLRLETLPRQGAWALHVGDSMLFGSGVAPTDALPAQLQTYLPSLLHRNGGVPGTSIDVELALVLRILEVARPNAIILYVMPGNDVDEVEAPVESCGGQPPVVWDGDTPRLRCPEPIWPERPWTSMLLQSPLPLPIAALTEHVWIARHLERLHRLALEPPKAHDARLTANAELYRRYLNALVARVQQANVPLVFVVMPLRRSQYGAHTEVRRAQLLAVLQATGLPIVDTQPTVDAWVQAGTEAAVFLDQPPGDIHLNAHGLQKLAQFLAPRLGLAQDATPTE